MSVEKSSKQLYQHSRQLEISIFFLLFSQDVRLLFATRREIYLSIGTRNCLRFNFLNFKITILIIDLFLKIILRWLRSGVMRMPDGISKDEVLLEAQFYVLHESSVPTHTAHANHVQHSAELRCDGVYYSACAPSAVLHSCVVHPDC